MRFAVKFLMAAVLIVPAGFVATQSAGAAGGTSCAHSSGTATFKPALPIASSSKTVMPNVGVKKGAVTSCSNGVTSATFNVKAKFHSKTNCQILLSGATSPNPPTGTLTATWKGKTHGKSVASITLNPVSGQATQTHITGTVTSGLFSGMHLDQTLSFSPKTGDCVTTPLSAVTFTEVTPLTIS